MGIFKNWKKPGGKLSAWMRQEEDDPRPRDDGRDRRSDAYWEEAEDEDRPQERRPAWADGLEQSDGAQAADGEKPRGSGLGAPPPYRRKGQDLSLIHI